MLIQSSWLCQWAGGGGGSVNSEQWAGGGGGSVNSEQLALSVGWRRRKC